MCGEEGVQERRARVCGGCEGAGGPGPETAQVEQVDPVPLRTEAGAGGEQESGL